jgi:flavorubredoxin
MKNSFKARKISDRVWWVGAIDWNVRDFHGYATQQGSTYNAFLIKAEKTTLIDTVKKPFKDELLARIASVIDPTEIDYIVSNHSEMDHTGCLQEVASIVKPEKIFASKMGVKALGDHFGDSLKVVPVADGGTLSLGDIELAFLETRMLHWPDSMFTYLPADKLLFSSDAFGMHLASYHRFADQLSRSVLEFEASKYFANILLPYASLVSKLIEKVSSLGLEIDTIAPDHGPVWRQDLDWIISLYAKLAEQKHGKKAVVVYDTMWGSTELMARSVAEGLAANGVEVKIFSLKNTHRSDVATELLDAGALLVGSPTLNNGLYPTVADLLCYIKGLKPKSMIAGAFGSFGWSGEAAKHIRQSLTDMKMDLVEDGPLKVKYVPTNDDLASCYALGERVAAKLDCCSEGSK